MRIAALSRTILFSENNLPCTPETLAAAAVVVNSNCRSSGLNFFVVVVVVVVVAIVCLWCNHQATSNKHSLSRVKHAYIYMYLHTV